MVDGKWKGGVLRRHSKPPTSNLLTTLLTIIMWQFSARRGWTKKLLSFIHWWASPLTQKQRNWSWLIKWLYCLIKWRMSSFDLCNRFREGLLIVDWTTPLVSILEERLFLDKGFLTKHLQLSCHSTTINLSSFWFVMEYPFTITGYNHPLEGKSNCSKLLKITNTIITLKSAALDSWRIRNGKC